jgi:signal transduction histidine kinase
MNGKSTRQLNLISSGKEGIGYSSFVIFSFFPVWMVMDGCLCVEVHETGKAGARTFQCVKDDGEKKKSKRELRQGIFQFLFFLFF